jgi:hypothetical protein
MRFEFIHHNKFKYLPSSIPNTWHTVADRREDPNLLIFQNEDEYYTYTIYWTKLL